MNFNNAKVEALIDALQDLAVDFETLKQGGAYRAIHHSLAQVFKSDAVAINRRLGRKVKPKAKGRASIRRQPTKPDTSVKSKGGDDCLDCPDTITNATNQPLPAPRMIGGGSSRAQRDHAKQTAKNKAGTIAEVIARFDNDAELMIAYSKAQRINVGNARKLETLAAKILAHEKAQ